MDDQLIILLCAFGATALLTYFVYQVLAARGADGKLRNRLTGKGVDTRRLEAPKPRLKEFVSQLGQRAAKPFMPNDPQKQFVIRRGLA
ncbi:MAG TPA: hypothetical protein VN541_11255, partial [Tepidisphaeraceae bacterium]|nr:hypothetical protein [Tepidisphaeraceae bacterium]